MNTFGSHEISWLKKCICIISFLVTSLSLSCFGQSQFTHVATKANNSCNGDCTLLDYRELNDNPSAIIWATPVAENGVNLNPHPIGVYYFKNRWSIFNLDQKPIPEGSKFTVEYVASPDETHFQYIVSKENLQKDGSASIDHPALNNNPSAKFNYFPSWNPTLQGGSTNREIATTQFNKDAGKWIISNNNNKPLFARVTYNIVLASKTSMPIPPVSNALEIRELIVAPGTQSVSTAIEEMFMAVWADGIKLPGDDTHAPATDKTEIFGFEIGVSKTSGTSRQAKSIYEPITIKIHSGVPATVPLFNAFVKKQGMELEITTYSTSQNGQRGVNYVIKLSGVTLSGFRQVYENIALDHTHSPVMTIYDEIKLTFSKIEYIKDGVSVSEIL